jgi:hypothetical protein
MNTRFVLIAASIHSMRFARYQALPVKSPHPLTLSFILALGYILVVRLKKGNNRISTAVCQAGRHATLSTLNFL